jgi:hypothetical protein
MNSHFLAYEVLHRLGECATHPNGLRGGTLTALLRVAGMSPLPRHALPSHPRTAHSGASNCCF